MVFTHFLRGNKNNTIRLNNFILLQILQDRNLKNYSLSYIWKLTTIIPLLKSHVDNEEYDHRCDKEEEITFHSLRIRRFLYLISKLNGKSILVCGYYIPALMFIQRRKATHTIYIYIFTSIPYFLLDFILVYLNIILFLYITL